jgi:hypothetical protein
MEQESSPERLARAPVCASRAGGAGPGRRYCRGVEAGHASSPGRTRVACISRHAHERVLARSWAAGTIAHRPVLAGFRMLGTATLLGEGWLSGIRGAAKQRTRIGPRNDCGRTVDESRTVRDMQMRSGSPCRYRLPEG